MSLLFNMLSMFVIAFLPRSKCFLISWLQSSSTVILELKERKSVTSSTFSPSISHEMMGLDAMILVFWMLTILFHLYQEAKWQPTPVFLPEESHGQRSLMGYSPRVGHDWVTNADTHTHTHNVLPLGWYHLHIWGCWYFSQQSWFQLMIHPAWHFTWCTFPRS